MTAESRKKFVLPCGRTLAASLAALRKCWLGFNIAKSQNNILRMQEFAYRIRKIQNQMGIKPTDFDQDIIDENTAMLIDMEKTETSAVALHKKEYLQLFLPTRPNISNLFTLSFFRIRYLCAHAFGVYLNLK